MGVAVGASALLHDAQALPAGDNRRGERGRLQKVGRVGALAPSHAGARGGDVQRRRARGAPVPGEEEGPVEGRRHALRVLPRPGSRAAPRARRARAPRNAQPQPRGGTVSDARDQLGEPIGRHAGVAARHGGSRQAHEAQGRPGVGERGRRTGDAGRGEDRRGSGGGGGGKVASRGGGGGGGGVGDWRDGDGGRGEAQIARGGG
mmetsp:Transcript_1962/g.7632  ORF Transcript_1962/g.7632 Transcript_1962/m.7632 type:complete len:204 (+) Transcript_1962:1079-1690(+)